MSMIDFGHFLLGSAENSHWNDHSFLAMEKVFFIHRILTGSL